MRNDLWKIGNKYEETNKIGKRTWPWAKGYKGVKTEGAAREAKKKVPSGDPTKNNASVSQRRNASSLTKPVQLSRSGS